MKLSLYLLEVWPYSPRDKHTAENIPEWTRDYKFHHIQKKQTHKFLNFLFLKIVFQVKNF